MGKTKELEKIEAHSVAKTLGGMAAFAAITWAIVYFIKKG